MIHPSLVSTYFSWLYGTVHDYTIPGIALGILAVVIYTTTIRTSSFSAIPAIGGTGLVSSYIAAIRALQNGHNIVQEGCRKYKNGVFQVPQFDCWHVVISERKLIEEMLKAPQDVFSGREAFRDTLASDYTLGRNFTAIPYHANVVRGALTQSIAKLFPAMREEVILSFEDYIPVTDGWTKIKAHETLLNIVARTSTRAFLGLPKCRDEDYLKLNIQFALDVFIGAQIIKLFPRFLKPLVGKLLTRIPGTVRKTLKHLQPIIEERQQNIDEYGSDYPDKPDDMLSWLMDEAKGEERSAKNLTMRVLVVTFAAVPAISMTITLALFQLAAQPEYLKPLREEIEAVVAEHGWGKCSVARMRKLDSFLKESVRVPGPGALHPSQKAMKPWTFSDGTHIPRGALVSSAFSPRNSDDNVYPGGDSFDGFRFSKLGDVPSAQLVGTSPDWLFFGYGRHSCPGRFFAATEVKAIMAHLILTYDVKMEHEGVRPEDEWFFFTCIPNRQAGVLFRKRQV